MEKTLLTNKEIIEKICQFLKEEFRKRKKTKAIVAISGGIDSFLTALFCQKAGLDLYTLILPYKKRGLEDAQRIVQDLNLAKEQIIILDIGPVVALQIRELQKVIKLDQIDKGNIMARQRMIIQYALARCLNGLVVGTKNLSEYFLGYFTLYGDSACDIAPLFGLFKTQVYEIAKYLAAPQWILEKRPSADFWSGQTDEAELGFTYKEADQILYFSLIKKYSKEEIIKKGFDKKIVNKVLERVKLTDYKRQPPPRFYPASFRIPGGFAAGDTRT